MRRSAARSLPVAPPDACADPGICARPAESCVPAVFGPAGLMASAFPGYEARAGQAEMSAAVERAVAEGEHLIVEGPTGTGKGAAYLVPAIREAAERGKRVVVVTANIGLQEQLCVGPEERILTVDLRHVLAGEIRVGDKLVGFDEEKDVGERRKLKSSVVLSVERIKKPCYRLFFDDGSTVVCSRDHLWLCGRSDTTNWLSAARMVPTMGRRLGSGVVRVTEVWDEDRSYEAGYMAAAVDGEGWLSQKTFLEKRHGRDYCRRLEIYERSSVMKFLGKYRPKRLLALFNPDLLGSLPTVKKVRVIRKVDIGEQKVISISTTSKTLIVNGLASHNCNVDLPALRAILPWPFTFAIAKGRAQWLCEEQFAETQREVSIKGAAKALGAGALRWREIEQWALTTRTGDLSECPVEPGALRPRVAVSAEECVGPHCPSRESCHSERAKRAYWAAQVIVTNYAMLFLDLQLRAASEGESGTLPAWDVAVLDEGHKCASIARDFFGFRVTEGMVKHAARLLDARDDAVDAELARELRREAEVFFSDLLDYRRSKSYRVRLRRPGELPESGSPLVAHLRRAADALTRARALVEDPARRQRLGNGARRCAEVADQLAAAHALAEPDRKVYCVEEEGDRAALVSKLIWPSEVLRERLFDVPGRSVVVTSATLSTGVGSGAFDFARSELGLDRFGPDGGERRELAVESPFDFARQALLVVPRGLPPAQGDRGEHERAVADTLVEVARATRGRVLGLFTSYRGLEVAKRAFGPSRPGGEPWGSVLVQGDAPRPELVRRFKAEVGSVLLGCESFWEGVDVPGEALSVVVIDRLPFASPDDPVTDAVDALTPGGAFASWSLPRAVVAVRQGAGRLIRRATDRGVVVVLDDRLMTKGYGRKFLRALPPMPMSRDLADVGRFLDRARIPGSAHAGGSSGA